MNYPRIFKIGFWVLVLATVWCCIGQCDQGRLSEAFALTDVGIRAGYKEQEHFNKELYVKLNYIVEAYPTPIGQKILDDCPQLQKMEHRYYVFLDSLRNQMLTAANLSIDQPLTSQTIKADKQIVQKVLLTGQPNAITEIATYTSILRTAMLALVNDDEAVAVALPIDFTASADGKYKLWGNTGNFQDLPLTGALAMLSNLQTAASAGMTMVLTYCERRIGSQEDEGCYFLPTVSAKVPYIMEGDIYEADIFLYAYSSNNVKEMKIKVNGEIIPIKDGTGHYESKAVIAGQRSFFVDISGINIYGDGRRFYKDTFRVTKEFAYQVVHPQCYTHRPANLYYLYAGVENPISVSAAYGSSCNDVKVTAEGAIITNKGGGHFTLLPTSFNSVTLIVGSQTEFQYQVHPLPDPLPTLANQSSDKVITQELLAIQTALNTRFPEDFDFQADCQIIDFHLTRFRTREDPEEVHNQGGDFNQQVRHLLEEARSGDRLLFDDIQVKCSGDERPRTINALSLRVQ